MSNRKRLPPPVPHEAVGVFERALSCDECGSTRTRRKFISGAWEITLAHAGKCSRRWDLDGGHPLAAAAVGRAGAAGFRLSYRAIDGTSGGVVLEAGGALP
jgi:hypothetical protein